MDTAAVTQRGGIFQSIKGLGSVRQDFIVDSVARETRPIDSILDIGCSYGWGLAALKGKANRFVGVDMDLPALEIGRQNHPQIEFVHQTAAELPFESTQFDVAILSEVIEHVGDENKQFVIDEAWRVLKPGGLFILTCPYSGIFDWLDPMDFKRRAKPIYRLYMRLSGYKPSTPVEVGHKHLSTTELMTLFGGRFEVERVVYCGFFSPFITWLLAIEERLHLLPKSLHNRLVWLRGWESGIPYWKPLAFNIRMSVRKK